MTLKIKDVQAALEPEEPDYDEAAKMGAEALPHLKKLVEGDNIELAAKAASLAGLIAEEGSADVLKAAASSHDPVVRVAAAGAARDLSDADASTVLEILVSDADVGVQKTALNSVPDNPSIDLRTRIADISESADVPTIIAESARQVVTRMGDADAPGDTETFNEMPVIGEEDPDFDAAASADESQAQEFAEEREMPGFGEASADEEGRSTELSENDSPGPFADEQEMPGFDDYESPTGVDGEESGNLGEMPP